VKKWLRNSIWAVLGTVIVYTAVAAYQGIIGSRADGILTALADWVTTSAHQNAAPWVITAVTTALFLVEGVWYWFHYKVLQQAIKKAHKMIALDGSLLRGMASLQPETPLVSPQLNGSHRGRQIRQSLQGLSQGRRITQGLQGLLRVSGSERMFGNGSVTSDALPEAPVSSKRSKGSYRERETEKILQDILRDALDELREHLPGSELTFRAAILVPDITGNYLGCKASWEMPKETIDRMKFYIGHDPQLIRDRGGAAGEAYRTPKLVRGHMIKLGDRWVSKDCNSYIDLPENRSNQSYLSFANVPLRGPDPRTQEITCFGIVCFDSKHEKAFDSAESEELLKMLAERIVVAIILCKRIW